MPNILNFVTFIFTFVLNSSRVITLIIYAFKNSVLLPRFANTITEICDTYRSPKGTNINNLNRTILRGL